MCTHVCAVCVCAVCVCAVCVCVCVCARVRACACLSTPRLQITSGVMWRDMYELHMTGGREVGWVEGKGGTPEAG